MVTRAKQDALTNFARRVEELCDDLKIPIRSRNKELGRLAGGVGHKGAEKWRKGLSMPDVPHGTVLCGNTGCNFEWLYTGRGPKWFGDRPDKRAPATTDRNEDVRLIAQAWPNFPTETKKLFRTIADQTLNQPSSKPPSGPRSSRSKARQHH